MLQSELREMSGGIWLKVNNFSLLDDKEQHDLVVAALKSGDITISTAASNAMLECGTLADAIDGAGYLPTASAYELSFHHIRTIIFEVLSPLIQDAIDEHNDSIDELLNEPPRPASDFK